MWTDTSYLVVAVIKCKQCTCISYSNWGCQLRNGEHCTALTVGGFNQPPVARTLIEQSGSAEIGLSQRFL